MAGRWVLALLLLGALANAQAEQLLVAARTDQPPRIDGSAADEAWQRAAPVTVIDGASDVPITLRALHDGREIFLLATFPDPDESRLHKPLVWNPALGMYEVGPQREDTLILKWNLSNHATDLTLGGDVEYHADTWFWKAHRTDPVEYADDKLQIYSSFRGDGSRAVTSRSGRLFYLTRKGDQGEPAYEAVLEAEYRGDLIPGFRHRTPVGSRADIHAKGGWADGLWTVEFRRLLDTGHADDLALKPARPALLAVSRYEVAGRPANPKQEQPLHGAGEVGELIRLTLE